MLDNHTIRLPIFRCFALTAEANGHDGVTGDGVNQVFDMAISVPPGAKNVQILAFGMGIEVSLDEEDFQMPAFGMAIDVFSIEEDL